MRESRGFSSGDPPTIRLGLRTVLLFFAVAGYAQAQNEIVVENQNLGVAASVWDVEGAGDPSIQGFATDISYAPGETVDFKIDTESTDYRLDVYRLGWYGGLGARKVATVQPSAALPQSQPACLTEPPSGLVDCGNWGVSASFPVPALATSGIYFAHLVREDPEDGRASHVIFVVRDDTGESDLLFQTMDTTWQAYNQYGGNSLYVGSPAGRAYKVSYNRPFNSRGPTPEDWVFNAESPMVRWLERNGYDVSYSTGVDTHRRGAELLEHEVYLSVAHDEYWSAGQRANVEAARAAGVDLAFFSGNEVFWKTRWEPSIDGSATPNRTLVSYKETHAGAKIDPEAAIWTGTWRDPRPFNPEGPQPENALTGQIFMVNCCAYPITVTADDGQLRFWRNTPIAALLPGQIATLPGDTLGYEWDEDLPNGARPPGLMHLSTTTVDVPERLQDYGSTYGPATATHHLTLYRHASGALVFGAGTIQWSWGLDGEHDRGDNPPDARMQQATVNLLADMGAQPATLMAGLALATASSDSLAPSSAIAMPSNGATVSGAVTVSGTAADAGGGVVGGVEVSVDGGATWQAASGRESFTYSWTPVVPGSATLRSRAVDDSGNLETPSSGVTVEVLAPTCPCSIWGDGVVPGGSLNETDNTPVELGVKFRSGVDGFVTALRFYKSASSTGPHVGHLWTSGGAQLAEMAFTGVSASGWQEVALVPPVAISANTTYVVSYHTQNFYAQDQNDLVTAFQNGPLRALANGEDGANGVYAYGPSGTFPAQSFNSSNYWVDLVVALDVGPDEDPPGTSSLVPAAGATDVAVGTSVSAVFDEPLAAATVSGATFELRDVAASLVPAVVTYTAATRTATLLPGAPLAYSSTYTATLSGGPGGITDVAGNALPAAVVWSFTTQDPPPPPPSEGPGGPILVITTAADPFGRYLAEILRTEGLNAFTAADLSLVDAVLLAAHEVVILADVALTAPQVALFADFALAGGQLIALRPDAQLAGLLGLAGPSGTLSDAYLQIDTELAPGTGLVSETLQFHGAADLWTAAGATVLATLYSDATTPSASPAVTTRAVGANGGSASAFTYDLARSVVYTRQGNPAWAGQERDGVAPRRSDDLFFGAAVGDPQPDWIDRGKVAIPQADEQQRLLAGLIRERIGFPLPRFWYFPGGERAVVILTGDEHGCCGGTTQRFEANLAASPPGCSVDDWECVRSSSYIFPGGGMSNAQGLSYHAQGFELGTHVNTGCANWTPVSLDAFFTNQLASFAAQFPGLPDMQSHRTHCIAWSDWASAAEVELAHGVRLDTNYYDWPPDWVDDAPGFFTGSGMPMRFARLDGSMIDVYQATTQMTDESEQSYPFTIDTLLDRAIGPLGYFGAFTANMHTDGAGDSIAGAAAIVASAQARGVPVVSGRQMLVWLDGRNASSFGSLAWNGSTLQFTVSRHSAARNLRALLPRLAASGTLASLTRGGSPVPFALETIRGIEYAVFAAETGSYVASYGVDGAPPLITGLVAAPAAGGNATISWNTDELSDSLVAYGTDPQAPTAQVADAALVSSHALGLTGLSPATTYYYRVTSADPFANSATAPALASPPASFVSADALCGADDLESDFSAGTPGAGIDVVPVDDGALTLLAALSTDFDGVALPPSWSGTLWQPSGSFAVAGGALTLDGALAGSDDLVTAGRSLELVATFGAAPFQHAGFGESFSGAPWAIFSTGTTGTTLQARTNAGSASDTTLGAALLGSPHRFKIEWGALGVAYYVDGALVATHAIPVAASMRPVASDLTPGGPALSVDWLRMSPYPSSGTFDSRVFDAGATSTWGAVGWTSSAPAGTSLSVAARAGGTPAPDGSWSAFVPIATPGNAAGVVGRYAQYRADLATADPTRAPLLEDVALACAPVTADTDGDGLFDVYETGTGVFAGPTDTGTDPLDPDSDDDGASDGAEVAAGTDPNNPASVPAAIPAVDARAFGALALLLLVGAGALLQRRLGNA